MIHWTWRVQLNEKFKQINNSWFWCVLSPSDSHQLSLDLNTVNNNLRLSERNRVITETNTDQSYPDHPDRFDGYSQVLCRESVCGRCYWELELGGDEYGCVFISVSYKSIRRKGQGDECVFGRNDQSWSLRCSPTSYSFRHNNIETDLSVKPISSKIGVFVDHGAGTLSFYSVSDTMSLIHTVQTTFTQTLYPGFWVLDGSVKLCWWIRIGCPLSPTLFNIYINELAKELNNLTAPGPTLTESEIKCLFFADYLVILSKTKEGLQQLLNIIETFNQTWALKINLTKKTQV